MDSGSFVALVGPDGVGKTSLAHALVSDGTRDTRYFHFRPDAGLTDAVSPSAPTEKYRGTSNAIVGVLRILVSAARFWVGYLRYIRPELRAGRCVIGDRWAFGYLVQPAALRYTGPAWLAELVVRLLPQPDIVVNLYADPELIRSRKDELTIDEIEAELTKWRDVPTRRRLDVNASLPLDDMAELVWANLR